MDKSRTWRWGYVEVPRGRRRARARTVEASAAPRRGVALVAVLVMLTILTVFVAELIDNSTSAFHATVSERDRLKAEYLAKSGLNLTRLLIEREPDIRKAISPIYGILLGKQPPQVNVWDFATEILAPFSDPAVAEDYTSSTGIDFGLMEGLTDMGGTFEIVAIPENSMINVSNPIFLGGDDARRSIAMQMFALMGGFQSPNSPYDPMFSTRDPDGQFTTRLDVISNLIDWWDFDEERTVFDPGSLQVAAAGSEDDIMTRYADPYVIKNAPYDSVEELRMIRGVGDDFWSTFVEGDPDDPKSRKITVYGSGVLNPNLAAPDVLLARLCSFAALQPQPLCQLPAQQAAFILLFQTARTMLPISSFTQPRDFLDFVSGQGNERGLYKMAMAAATLMGGPENPLMAWTPFTIPPEQVPTIEQSFVTSAAIFTLQATGHVGRARARISAVVNFHNGWTPPPPNTAKPPPLGVVQHYRID
jgi:general secretion pathway protein K